MDPQIFRCYVDYYGKYYHNNHFVSAKPLTDVLTDLLLTQDHQQKHLNPKIDYEFPGYYH